jgi:hypothetical protein
MKINIDKLTEPELIELNHKIVERLKFLESKRAYADMMAFNIGEQVSFSPPGRGEVTGMLVKYNQKTIVSLNCRDEFPQTVDRVALTRAICQGREAEREKTTVRSSSRRDPSVWPPWLE